jgi:hypothetical protein
MDMQFLLTAPYKKTLQVFGGYLGFSFRSPLEPQWLKNCKLEMFLMGDPC